MKKLVFGCFGILVLFALAGALGGYLFVIRPAREHLAALRQMTMLGTLDKQVLNQRRFEPPLSRELTPEMVERFTRVQQAVRNTLGRRFAELQERAAELEAVVAPGSAQIDLAPVVHVYQELANVLTEAKRVQVEALNEAGFSLEEYAWVRERVFEAGGLLAASVDLDTLRQAVMTRQDALEVRRPFGHEDVPALNRQLVEPHLERFADWLPLAWFGL